MTKEERKAKRLQRTGSCLILMAVFLFGFLVADTILKHQYNASIKGMENDYNENLKTELIKRNFNTNISFKPENVPQTEEEIINNCKLLSLKETAQCLLENIGTFYNYTITDDKINLTLKDLQKVGGDCRDWAMLYERLAKNLNIKSTTISSAGIRDIMAGHRWTVIWDDYEYCKLDQLEVNCYKSKKAINNDETR